MGNRQRRIGSATKHLTGASLAVAVILASSACGGNVASGNSRSIEAYCSVIEQHKERYVTGMNAATAGLQGNPDPMAFLNSIGGALSSLGDLAQMWDQAERVAPDEIRDDVAATAEWYDEQWEVAERMLEDPLGGLMGALTSGMKSSASLERVDRYTAENCPGVGGMFVQ